MESIEGRVAVVTGAAQGNGKAIATGLAEKGARLALCDIQYAEVCAVAEDLVAQGYEACAYEVDVTNPVSCNAFASSARQDLGDVSILVNNAGIIRRTLPDDANFEEDWAAVLRVNADGPMYMIRAFLDQLRNMQGNIINLASIMSIATGPGLSAYAASKGAVLQMTRALAQDLAKDGIRVNAIAPGVIDTPMTEITRKDPDAIGRFMIHTPMGRTGKPEELVGPVLFLASDMSTYVTGVMLPVDGGYLTA